MDWWFKYLFNKQIYELPDTSANAKILKEVYNMKSTRVIINVLLSLGLPKLDSEDTEESQWQPVNQSQAATVILKTIGCP